MFKTDEDSLWQEVQAAEKRRDKHLQHVDELTKRFTTGYYSEDYKAEKPVVENYAFELWSIIKMSLIYASPQCSITCSSPEELDDEAMVLIEQMKAQYGAPSEYDLATMHGMRYGDFIRSIGGMTMGQSAKGLELAINRWSINNRVYRPLLELALDYFFCWGVGYVTTGNQPGRQSYEMMPQQPYIVRLPGEHFILDAGCHSANVESVNGPRLLGHMWKADHDDLMEEEGFDHDAIAALGVDMDLQKFDLDRKLGGNDRPKRREVLAYELWVPDDGFAREELAMMGAGEPSLYTGSWHTIAVTSDGGSVSKRSRVIRERRPAYVPPWGPYTMFGYHEVRNNPYYLSLVTATAERAESLNEHLEAASDDAKSYKKILAAKSSHPDDATAAKTARNGTIQLFHGDVKNDFHAFEIGGVSPQQYAWIDREENHLMKAGGVSSSRMGQPDKRVTATAESIADAGGQAVSSGIKGGYKMGIANLYRTAAWFMFHGDDVKMKLGEDGARVGIPEYVGGILGRSLWDFEQLSVQIDQYSMEHTDATMVQRKMLDVMTWFRDTAPIMAQTPHIGWRDMCNDLLKIININGASRWINEDILNQMQQIASQPQPAEAGGQQPQQEQEEDDPEARANEYLRQASGSEAMDATLEASTEMGQEMAV